MIKIQIPQEIVDAVEHYNIEYEAAQEVIIKILENNKLDINQNLFKIYQKEYDHKFYMFNKYKKEIEEKYVIPQVNDNLNYTWHLNYTTKILTIYIQENNETI